MTRFGRSSATVSPMSEVIYLDETPAVDDVSDEADGWRRTFLRCGRHVPDDALSRRLRAFLVEYWRGRGERPTHLGVPEELKDLG